MLLTEISNFKSKHDVTFHQALEQFAAKFGLGKFSGNNAVVLTRDGHVWRAWFKDAGYEKFLAIVSTMPSPHLPKILSRIREEPVQFARTPKDMTIKYVKVEKLEALEPSNFSDAVDAVGTALYKGAVFDSIKDMLSADLKIPSHSDAELDDILDEIKKHESFFKLIIKLSKRHNLNDLNSENVMMRGNVPVITDPISSNA